jgi:hypothetical protein
VPIAGRPESLARGAPEDPGRVVLRTIQVR